MFTDIIGLSSTTVTQRASKAIEFGEKTQNKGYYAVQSHSFSLGVAAGALRAIIGSKSAISLQWVPVDPKFQVEGVAPTNHSFSHKSSLNVLLYGIKIWTDFSSVLT